MISPAIHINQSRDSLAVTISMAVIAEEIVIAGHSTDLPPAMVGKYQRKVLLGSLDLALISIFSVVKHSMVRMTSSPM